MFDQKPDCENLLATCHFTTVISYESQTKLLLVAIAAGHVVLILIILW